MRDPEAQSLIRQLQREVRNLRNEITRLKSKSTNAAAAGTHVAVLQAISEIAGRTEAGGVYSIDHGGARLFDVLVRDSADPWTMQVVTSGGVDPVERVVELGNMWSEPIAADEFLLATSYGKVYLHGAQECASG